MTRDIRVTRDRLGLSTAELARLVGVSYRAAHHWMEGKAVPEPVWRLLELHQKHQNITKHFTGLGHDISTGYEGTL
jgi:DNA-binding transcriptional regulator YiaG